MALTAKKREEHWLFAAGDLVYIAGQEQQSAKVTAAISAGRCNWPHYLVVDHQGAEWLVAQVQLSKLPITDR